MIYDYRKAAESNKQSAMYVLLAMARGMPEGLLSDKILFQCFLHSVNLLNPKYIFKKAIPLQTETRLMLDTV